MRYVYIHEACFLPMKCPINIDTVKSVYIEGSQLIILKEMCFFL